MINIRETGFTMFPNKARRSSFWKHLPSRELYTYIIYDCAYKPTNYNGIQLNIGQTIIGPTVDIANELDLTVQQIRTAMKKIEETGALKLEKISTGRWLVTSLWHNTTTEQQINNEPITDLQQINNEPITDLQHVNNEQITKQYQQNQPQNQCVVTDLQHVNNEQITSFQQVNNEQITDEQQANNEQITKTPIVLKQYSILNTQYTNNTHTHNNNIFNNTACASACACAREGSNQSLLGDLTKSCGECETKERGGIEGNTSEKRLRTLAEEIYKVHPKHGSTTNMMKIIETVLEDAGSPGMTLDMAIDKFETATRQYLDEVKSWNKTDLRYAIPLDRWCAEKRYQEDPAIWAKNSNKANGGSEGERFAKHGYSFDPVNERGLERAPHEIAMMEALEEATKTGVTMSSLLPKYYAKHGIPIE